MVVGSVSAKIYTLCSKFRPHSQKVLILPGPVPSVIGSFVMKVQII